MKNHNERYETNPPESVKNKTKQDKTKKKTRCSIVRNMFLFATAATCVRKWIQHLWLTQHYGFERATVRVKHQNSF